MFGINARTDTLALQATLTRGSTYQKMGMIPIVSNIKGALEAAGGLTITAISIIASVALGAMYLVSKVFSSDRRSMSQIIELLEHRHNELSCAEKLKALTIVSLGLGILGLNVVYHGFQQQVPFIGNLCYALDVGRSLQNA